MLKRIRIKGYKSLEDVEVELNPLTLLMGPNAAGKSNFLDALQLLSKLATSRTVKEAFDAPYRGKPLESFTFGPEGIAGLRRKKRISFILEVDIYLSDQVVESVNHQVLALRRSSENGTMSDYNKESNQRLALVRERNLRYRVEIEMLPNEAILRVADEYLVALNSKGEPARNRKPFIEQQGGKIRLRMERQSHPVYHERYLDKTVLSMPHYSPHHPHLEAAKREMESWKFYYFEPRELMRLENPLKEVRHIGPMGEELAAYLHTANAFNPKQFHALKKSLHTLLPRVNDIDTAVDNLGEIELQIDEDGVKFSARLLSEGTLRMLGLLASTGIKETPSLVGIEEPENGVHPVQIELIAEFFNARLLEGNTQYIITSHSPILPDYIPSESLYIVKRESQKTVIDHFSSWGPLFRKNDISGALDDGVIESVLPVSERIMRGDFDA